MLDLIFLLGIAVIIFIRLFKIFGHTDNNSSTAKVFENSVDNFDKEAQKPADIEIISATEAALAPHIRDVFDKIREVEGHFNADVFVSCAKKAFITIINAFTKYDKQSLQMLLSSDVYKVFSREMEKRISSGYLYNKTVIGVRDIEITDAYISDHLASITLRIVSDQVSYVKDKAGNLLNGNTEKIVIVEDAWQFGKKIGQDKIWLLLSTSAVTRQ